MSVVNMEWKEGPFDGLHDNGQQEGFVYQILGPSFVYPSHRQPVVFSPHRCNNADNSSTIIIPIILAITFERSSSRTHTFTFDKELDNPQVKISLTTEPNPYGKCLEFASGSYNPPRSVRETETYRESGEEKVAEVQFEMNEVKAFFLNLAFECDQECPFSYGGSYDLWASYWGYWNYCRLTLVGAPDHGALVDMKYQRPPRS